MSFSALKSTFLAFGLFLLSSAASAQTMQDIISKPEIPLTWMGMDFSAVKYIGNPGTVAPDEMKGLFTKINDLMINEPDKYDFAKAFKRNKVNYNISFTESVNAKIDPATLIISDLSQRDRFNVAKIEAMVKKYAYPAGSTGTGLVFVMEDLVKPQELTVFWITFVDLASRKVLYTEKIGGTALGFGFRNHWAGGIYAALKHIKSTQYGEWKKKFAKGK